MPSLNQFFLDNRFRVEEKVTYGIYRNRMISFCNQGTYFKVTITFNSQLNREQGQAISNKTKEIKMNNRALLKAVTTNVFLELLIYKSAEIDSEFFPIIEQCLDVLDEHSVLTCEVCPFCGKALPTNSPFVRINEYVLQAHNDCVNQLLMTTTNLSKKIAGGDKKNIFQVLVTSFLCMILVVSIVLAFEFMLGSGFIIFLSGWLCCLLSKIFLRRLKVAASKKGLIIITVCSILAVILSVYFGTAANIVKNNDGYSYVKVLSDFIPIIIKNYETVGKFVIFDLIMGIILLVLVVMNDFKNKLSFGNKIYKIK